MGDITFSATRIYTFSIKKPNVMKKVFTLLALLALVSCNQDGGEIERPTKYHRVVIGLAQSRQGAITKVTDAEVQEVLTITHLENTLTMRLTSKKDGTVYAVNLGEPVDLPVGEYALFGEYSPTCFREAYAAYLYLEPPFYVEEDITITEEQDTYYVDAKYLCAAFVFDMKNTSKVEHRAEIRTYAELPLEGDLPVVYARCNMLNSTNLWTVKVTSTNPLFAEPTVFQLNWTESGDGLHVKDGYWYLLAPDIPVTTHGTINVTWTEWNKG